MKAIQKYIFSAILLLMALCVASCSHHPDVPPSTVSFDSIASRLKNGPPPPLRPGRLTSGPYLTDDSLRRFVKDIPGDIKGHGHGKPFNSMDYNKVVAYEFEGSEEPYPHIIHEGKLVPVITKQTALDQKQVDEITILLSNNDTYGGAFASCFDPHLALIFYKDTLRVMVTDICVGCNYLLSSPTIPATESHMMDAGTGQEYAAMGFSSRGKAHLKKFCDQLGYVYSRESLNLSE